MRAALTEPGEGVAGVGEGVATREPKLHDGSQPDAAPGSVSAVSSSVSTDR